MRRTLSTAALLLASGCLGDLLNIGEGPDRNGGGGRETGGTGGGAATAGTSGASGTSGAAGAGDDGGSGAETGGSTSSGGTATDGGTGGVAGGNGGAGAGGTAGKGEPTSDPDVIARAAVALGSCIYDDGVSRHASLLWNSPWNPSWEGFRQQAECLAGAGGGCRALDTCLGWAIEEKPGCTPGRVCDGSKFTDCIDVDGVGVGEWRIDCATIGLACDTRVGCVSPPAVGCDMLSYVANCSGERPQSCDSDPEGPEQGVVFVGPDCANLGLECVAETRGTDNPIFAACTGTGEECDWEPETFAVGIACAGNMLEACVNARRHVFDCSASAPGFSCQSYDGIPFCGLASECVPGETYASDRDLSQQGIPAPACDGTSIVFCNAGRLERIDCTDLGFTGCDLELGLGCVPSPTSDFPQ